MELHDYLRILRTHAKVMIAATVIGALFGGLVSFLNRPEPVSNVPAPYLASIDLTLVSEQGRRDLADRLSDLISTTAQAEITIDNPAADRSPVDYAQLLLSDPVREAAARTLDQEASAFDGRIEATADPETITVTLEGDGRRAARQEMEAVIQAFREVVSTGNPMDASARILITTQTPNADVQTSAGYTESRMPTYAALATSDVVLAPTARNTRVSLEDLRAAVSVKVEPDTTILTIDVTDPPSSTMATQVLAAVQESLEEAIASVESTPVDFQDLGSSAGGTGSSVRVLSNTVSEPSVMIGEDGPIPTPTVSGALTTLAGESPISLAPSTAAVLEPLSEDEQARINELVETGQDDGTSITITPVTQISGIADSPLNASTVRVTATGNTPQEAAAFAEAAVAALEQRVATTTDPEPWPLQLVPNALVATSEVVETTTTAQSSATDRTTVNIILGLLIGLALGVGYAFFMASRDRTIYGPRQLVDATGEPAFGVIPTSNLTTGWAAQHEHDLGGEGYRALRSNVLLGLKDTTVLALVSPVAGTGTHTVGINLAISLAQSGSRVCVVETALSQPRLAALLGTQAAPGLADVIEIGADLDNSIQQVPSLGFDVLTAGTSTNDVTDTLTSRKLKDTIDDLRDRYDVVITLCAPAVESPEASAVTPLSDATLILIRVASTSMTDLEITARVLLQVNTKIAGIIANDVPHEHTDQWRRYLPVANPQPDDAA